MFYYAHSVASGLFGPTQPVLDLVSVRVTTVVGLEVRVTKVSQLQFGPVIVVN